LTYAIEKVDLESFKFLLQQLIEHQSNHQNSYILDEWVTLAINRDIDLQPLFESKLCTQNLTDGTIKNVGNFPEFHKDPRQVTEKFTGNMTDLVYCTKIYEQLFSKHI
jgi:hypothetical protein